MLIGHEKAWQYFENAANSGSLAHAYVIAGPAQVGKRSLAKQVAAKLLGLSAEKLAASPDYYYVERVVDEKTGKLNKDFKVYQATDLQARFQNSSWSGGYQIAIIDDAELFNLFTGNRLLRILEEPPKKTVFFLLTENEDKLLPTVSSRSQVIYLQPVREAAIVKGLMARGRTETAAREIAKLAWGRPGRAIELSGDEELWKNLTDEEKRWKDLANQLFYKKIKIIESLFGEDKDDHIRSRDRLRQALEIWQMQAREDLVKNAGSENCSGLVSQLNALSRARELIKQNIHPRLLVEDAVIER